MDVNEVLRASQRVLAARADLEAAEVDLLRVMRGDRRGSRREAAGAPTAGDKVLAYLRTQGSPQRVAEIAAGMGLDVGKWGVAVRKSLERLRKKGAVRREAGRYGIGGAGGAARGGGTTRRGRAAAAPRRRG